MKKIYSFLAGILLLLTQSNANALSCVYTIGSVTGITPGTDIVVPFTVNGIDTLAALGFVLNWDVDVLTYKSFTIKEPKVGTPYGLGNHAPGSNYFMFAFFSSLGTTLLSNDTLVLITFTYNGGVTTLRFDPENCVATDNAIPVPNNYDIIFENGFVAESVDECKANFKISNQTLKYTYQFNDNSGGAHITGWDWDFGDGNTSNEENPIHTFPASGLYLVCFSISSENNGNVVCSDTICENIYVQSVLPEKKCNAFFKTYFDTKTMEFACYDASDGQNIAEWQWDFGDNTTSNERNPKHKYAQHGQYNVCLTIKSTSGGNVVCSDTYCREVFFHYNPVTKSCQSIFYTTKDAMEDTYNFHGFAVGNVTGWHWEFGDNTESIERNPVHTFDNKGEYVVCLDITASDSIDGECTDTYCQTVNVNQTPPLSFCFNHFSYKITDTLNSTLKVDFAALTKASEPLKYIWNFGDGDDTTITENIISHEFNKGSNYDVCLTTKPESDPSSCSFTSCQTVFGLKDSIYNLGKLSGTVYAGTNFADKGYVALVKLDSSYITYLDVAEIESNGSYNFSYIPYGNYFVFAFPDIISQYFDNYLPSFYGDTWDWEQAKSVLVGSEVQKDIDIHLVKLSKEKSYGNGCISGNINIINPSPATNSKAAYLEVVILDIYGNPLGFTYSDVDGNYKFSGLPYGSYMVHIEVIGLKAPYINLTISEDESCPDYIDFNIDYPVLQGFSSITSVDKAIQYLVNCSEVFPNPVNGTAYVKLSAFGNQKSVPLIVDIYNNIGQKVQSFTFKQTSGKSTINFSTEGLREGMYFVRISGNGINVMRRFVKL